MIDPVMITAVLSTSFLTPLAIGTLTKAGGCLTMIIGVVVSLVVSHLILIAMQPDYRFGSTYGVGIFMYLCISTFAVLFGMLLLPRFRRSW